MLVVDDVDLVDLCFDLFVAGCIHRLVVLIAGGFCCLIAVELARCYVLLLFAL